MISPTSDWNILNGALLRLYRELEPARHTETMLSVVQEFVPGDTIVLNVFEVPTRRYSVTTLPAGVAKPDEVERVGRYLHQSPFPAYYTATNDAQWKMTTDFMPLEDFHATELHREMIPWGIDQQMCGMLAFVDNAAHAITINRKDRGFEERERAVLNALHPHLVTSYLNAMKFGQAQKTTAELRGALETAPGAYGCVRPDGSVAWLQERARVWLGEFFGAETTDEDGLPASIRRLVEESRAADNAPRHTEAHAGSDRLVACLSASALGGWILRLERSALLPRLTLRAVPGLSPREQEVLRWMVEGKRNGEIATILGLSVRTVEKHVEANLRALQAENRATAIVRAIELSARPSPGEVMANP